MRHSREEILALMKQLDHRPARELESETLEFKEWSGEWNAHPKKLYRFLAEYAVCFANHKGGTLVLGVRDDVKGQERAITGCGHYNLHEIRARIYDLTDPKILVEVEELPLADRGVRLLLVHIPQGISAVHTTTEGVAKIRVGTECKPMTGTLRMRRLIETGALDPTAEPVLGLDRSALDPLEVERLRQLIRARLPNSTLLNLGEADFLEQTGITRGGIPTGAGLLLVGKEPKVREHFPSHEIEYLRMKSDTEYERRETFHCGLLRALEEVYRNVELYNPITSLQVGLFRYEIKDFPEETYREAVLNAALHRDYFSFGSVFVKQYRDRMEVSNPGGFLPGITPENILRHDSHPRNRHLAEVLRRIGLIEKAGMGVKRMFYTQLLSGKPPPHYWTDGASVRLTLMNGTMDEPFVRFVRQREKEGHPLGLDQLLVLSALRRQRELALPEAAAILQLELPRTREILMSMVREGLMERSGVRKGQVFRMSGSVYRKLGESVAYIRERGIDALRYEELILEFVRRHGSVTNRQARELLGVDRNTATRLLTRLRTEKQLKRLGKRRGAVYVLPNAPKQ